jgi:hypothetical protein
MTATQWLIQQLLSVGRLEIQKDDYLLKIIEQAKEIEKIQIIDCLKTLLFDISQGKDVENIELYYNETFKNTNK